VLEKNLRSKNLIILINYETQVHERHAGSSASSTFFCQDNTKKCNPIVSQKLKPLSTMHTCSLRFVIILQKRFFLGSIAMKRGMDCVFANHLSQVVFFCRSQVLPNQKSSI